MKDNIIYEFMIKEREHRVMQNEIKIQELKQKLAQDKAYFDFISKINLLETKKEELESKINKREEHYNFLEKNEIILTISNQIQGECDRIASLEEKRVMSSFIVETESKKSYIPKIFRNFYKYYNYRKIVNEEELHEHISIFTELVPFINLYKKVNEDASKIERSNVLEKYQHLTDIYSSVQKKLIDDKDKNEDRYSKENNFMIRFHSVQNKFKKCINILNEQQNILNLKLNKVKENRQPILDEIRRLEEENASYLSQADKLRENLIEFKPSQKVNNKKTA